MIWDMEIIISSQSMIWGEHNKLCAGSTLSKLIYSSFERYSQRCHNFRGYKLQLECRPIAEEGSGTTEVGCSNRLNSHWWHIDRALPNPYLASDQSPHSTHHIFSSQTNPTLQFTFTIEVSQFLDLNLPTEPSKEKHK